MMLNGYLIAATVIATATALNAALARWFTPTDVAMIFLLGVVFTATQARRGPSIACALGSVAAFDFFFVPPIFTFRFAETQYVVTALVLLAVSLIVSSLAAHLRNQTRAAIGAELAASDERLRNSLLASISHDLRTPLAVIAGSASHLIENGGKTSDSDRLQQLGRIYAEAQYVNRVVSDLLDMTRLQSGPVHLDRQWYPVEELVGSALERAKSALEGHTVELRLHKDVSMVHVDGVLIEKVLINILENAGKYTPPGSVVKLSTTRTGNRLTISVEDNGPGLPPNSEERLFEKFYRGASEGAIGGAGLGLTICRAIARAHGGDIAARNGTVCGAAFDLSLPFVDPPTVPPEAAS